MAKDDSVEGSSRVLEITERAENEADAAALCKKKLAAANSREITGSITLKGDNRFSAGVNIELEGFGMFSGKYLITRAAHSVSGSGYTTSLDLQMGSKEKKAAKAKKKKKQSVKARELFYEGSERHFDIDEAVFCVFNGEAIEDGLILCSFYDDENFLPEANHEWRGVVFDDGTRIFYDRGAHEFSCENTDGSYIRMKGGEISIHGAEHVNITAPRIDLN